MISHQSSAPLDEIGECRAESAHESCSRGELKALIACITAFSAMSSLGIAQILLLNGLVADQLEYDV